MAGQQLDDVMLHLGTGWWNVIHFITVGFGAAIPAPHGLAGVFFSPKVGFTCVPPPGLRANVTPDECSYVLEGEHGLEQHKCTHWDFDNSTFTSTVTGEYRLVCETEYLRSVYQSMYMFGVLVGSPINGVLADRYGRRPLVVGGSIMFTSIALGSVWLSSFQAILAARFVVGLAHSTLLKTAYILALEVSSPNVRYIVGSWVLTGWAINTIVYGAVAYFIRDWRMLQLTMSLFGILHLPGIWFLDESPRWLAVVGRHEEALRVLRRAASWNKVELPSEDAIRAVLKAQTDKYQPTGPSKQRPDQPLGARLKHACMGAAILFRTPRLRTITCVSYLAYLVVAMVYFGISLSGASLSSDPFVYLVLMGVVEVPPSAAVTWTVARYGRRACTAVNFLLSGVVLFVLAFVPGDVQWAVMVLAMVGKVTITAAFASLNLFASELFPTEVRTRGINTSFMMSRVGAMAAPFIADLLGSVLAWAPPLVYGGASVVAALATMGLIETMGVPLPDTIAQLENAHTPVRKYRGIFRRPVPHAHDHTRQEEGRVLNGCGKTEEEGGALEKETQMLGESGEGEADSKSP